MKSLFIFIFYLLLSLSVYGQGFPISSHYAPDDYGYHQQNWKALVDSNQFLFVVSGSGIVYFDGVKWSQKHIGEYGRGKSLFINERNEFFVSGQTDFAKIINDSTNSLSIESLSDEGFDPSEIFNEHNFITQRGDTTIFIGWFGIDLLIDEKVERIRIDDILFPLAFELKGNVHFVTSEGIFQYKSGELINVTSSDSYNNDRLFFGEKFDEDHILIGAEKNGLYLFDGITMQPFQTSDDTYIKDSGVFSAHIDKNKNIYVGTLSGGLIKMDNGGRIQQIYNQNNGYDYQGILDLYEDHEGTLWMSLWGGLEKRFIQIPVNYYGINEMIESEIVAVHVFDDRVYLQDLMNLYLSFTTEEGILNFSKVETDYSRLQIIPSGDDFPYYAYNSKGIYRLDSELRASLLISDSVLVQIYNMDSEELLYITTDGSLKNDSGEIILSDLKLSELRVTRAWQKSGNIFIQASGSLYEIRDEILIQSVMEIDPDERIQINHFGIINDEVYLATEGVGGSNGLFKYDQENRIFEKAEHFGKLDPDLTNRQVLTFEECNNGDVWFHSAKEVKRFYVTEDGDSVVTNTPFQMIGGEDAIYDIACGNDESVWFGGVEGLYQLTNPDWEYTAEFKTNITGIYVDNDSLIYGGFGEPVLDLILPYENNALRFTYAASSYIDETQNSYSVLLEGFDSDWSSWTTENQKDYTNIPEGDYVFKVRSKNVLEAEGILDSISFSVLPPWYRTWWAYIIYLLSAGGILYAGFRIRLEQLLKVERMRTRIASDLHDEISATLTGISYFAEAVDKDDDDQNKKRFVTLIRESASDAKEKITDIVWSINPEHDDITAFLARCRRYASDLLESKGIQYKMEIPEKYPGKLPMDYRQHFWLIFKEILTNAVRHSGASQLNIRIHIKKGALSLLIQDNGHGFNETEQVQGNGLSNIRRRAEQMNASVDFDSDPDYGTRWHISINI